MRRLIMVKTFLYFFRQRVIVFFFLALWASLGLAQQQMTTGAPKTSDQTTVQVDNAAEVHPQPNMSIMPSPNTAIVMGHDLSPWGMYLNADIVVKVIMIALLMASLVTWTIFIAKSIALLVAKRHLKREMKLLKPAKTLKQAHEISSSFNNNSLSALLLDDIQEELDLSANTISNEGIKERAAFRQDRLVAASGRKMNAGTNILASIGSVSPFVGLFGTVWGIMNSFIGIAKSQTTNLAVVAPGIAEALLATALGLVAAIPAVIIYNVFVRSISHYKVLVSDISAHGLLLLSRDLDRKKETVSAPQIVPTSISKLAK